MSSDSLHITLYWSKSAYLKTSVSTKLIVFAKIFYDLPEEEFPQDSDLSNNSI